MCRRGVADAVSEGCRDLRVRLNGLRGKSDGLVGRVGRQSSFRAALGLDSAVYVRHMAVVRLGEIVLHSGMQIKGDWSTCYSCHSTFSIQYCTKFHAHAAATREEELPSRHQVDANVEVGSRQKAHGPLLRRCVFFSWEEEVYRTSNILIRDRLFLLSITRFPKIRSQGRASTLWDAVPRQKVTMPMTKAEARTWSDRSNLLAP